MTLSKELAELYRRDLTRMIQQVEAFPDTESLWRTLPGTSNSAGNLILHLEGNLREFIGRQLGNIPFQRHRPSEFTNSGLTARDLTARIVALKEQIPPAIARLTTAQLEDTYPEVVLGTPLSVQQFLIHLQGHLNYHLGQIDYLRRILTSNGAIPLAM